MSPIRAKYESNMSQKTKLKKTDLNMLGMGFHNHFRNLHLRRVIYLIFMLVGEIIPNLGLLIEFR